MFTPKEYITSMLKQSIIVVFSKPMCVLCDKIKKELKDTNIEFLDIDITTLDEDEVDSIEVINELKNQTKSNSYPFCFYDEEYIVWENLIKKLMMNNNNNDYNIDSL